MVLILSVFGVPSTARADWEDALSRFQFYATATETYDSNVDLTPNNKRYDFITTVGAGVRFSTLPRSEITREFQKPTTGQESAYGVTLDFLPSYVYYAKGTSDNYLSLAGNLDAWYTWDRKLTFRLKDYLTRSQEPLEESYASGALPGQVLLGNPKGRAIYIRNVVTPSLEYQFARESLVGITYTNNVYNNQSSLYEDSVENYINPRLVYWFDVRNGISLEYGLELGNFERSPDTMANSATGRYTHRFNPRTSVFGEFRFEERDFDPQTIGNVNYEVYTPTVGFAHAFSPTLSLTGQFGYFWQHQKIGPSQNGPVFNVLVTQRTPRTTYTLGVEAGYTEDYYTADNLGFAKYQQAIGTITHQIAQKASVTFSGRYQRPKYNDGRTDNLWGVNGGLSYQALRWLTFGLDLSYAENHSNRNINDYTDFRGIFSVTATL